MLNENLQRLSKVAQSPQATLEAYLASGKKVAGCIPEYTPEAMIHAAGYLPFGMWGGETTIMQADRYIPTFACSLMRSCVEYGLTGAYKGLSFAVAPILCDALKGCVQTFRVAVQDFPILPFSLPQNRTLPTAADFVVGEYQALKQKIERIAGAEISAEALWQSINIYNAHRQAMREFDAVAADHTDVITASVREAVFKSAWFMEKSEHTAIIRQMTAELAQRPICHKNRVRAVLTGVTAGSFALMQILEEEGIDVVGDQVCQDSWTYRQDIPVTGPCPISALAEHWMCVGGSCVTHETHRSRAATILDLAAERKATAVVLCLMKFCDPEEYEAPLLLTALKCRYPTISLEIDQNSDNLEQLRTRIQSFQEMTS